MPQIKDYANAFVGYFTKNYGINSVTSLLVPPIVQTIAVGNASVADAVGQGLDTSTVSAIFHGGPGMYAAILMLMARIGLALGRTSAPAA